MDRLRKLRKEHETLIQEFRNRKKELDTKLSMSLQSVVCCSVNIVKSHERLAYYQEQVTIAFEEFNDVLERLMYTEKTMEDLLISSRETRIKEGYTGNQICRDLAEKHGSLNRAFKYLGVNNTRLHQALKGRVSVGEKQIETLSNLLGLDIIDYLDEYGSIQQEDE